MSEHKNISIFEHLNVKPVINGCGIYTDLGGSRLSPEVWAAMEEMNERFAHLPELMERAGARIATTLGAEAALITPGAAAGIMLGTAACMAGTDGAVSQRLPDVRGLKSEVLIQRSHRYKYDRQASMTGASLVEVGSETGATADDFTAAIKEDTGMILYPAHLESKAGSVPLAEVAAVAVRHDIPVFVDAAYMNYPTSVMSSFVARGASLVTFSAKYFGGPNAGGFIMGRRDLIEAVSNVHFTQYESGAYLKYGRPLKMDRQIVVAVICALEEWLGMDHEERLREYAACVEVLRTGLEGTPGLDLTPMCFTMDERLVPEPVNCLVIGISETSPMDGETLEQKLADDNPRILTVRDPGLRAKEHISDNIVVVVDVMTPEEAAHVARRIHALASG